MYIRVILALFAKLKAKRARNGSKKSKKVLNKCICEIQFCIHQRFRILNLVIKTSKS
jgi:hypothetical protein